VPERAWGFKSPLGHTHDQLLTCGNAAGAGLFWSSWDHPWDQVRFWRPVVAEGPVTVGHRCSVLEGAPGL
jgi:hypothetical protein